MADLLHDYTVPARVLSGGAAPPMARSIGVADVVASLRAGWSDFTAMPTHAIFLCLIYPVVGLFIGRFVYGANILPLLFPLMAGFALLGPFAALGLYEMSRRREQGLVPTVQDVFAVRRSRSFGAILTLGVLLMVIFLTWIAVAQSIYVAYFGYAPAAAIPDFLSRVFDTPAGWGLILVGNGVGFLFALLVLMISAISFPLLLDRDVGVAPAMLTSVRAFAASPGPLLLWGLIVAIALALGSIPLFFGLAVAIPVLGHATWHLYRRVVV